MRKFKTILTAVLVAVLVMPLAAVLVACGGNNGKFTSSKDIKSNAETLAGTLASKVYNASAIKGQKKSFTVNELKTALNLDELNYYVEVGTIENIDQVNSISLDEVTFKKDETVSLSIGSSNFIKDKAFYVENSKLYVAAPIMAFELASDNEIKINDKVFKLNVEDEKELNITDVTLINGSPSTISKAENTEKKYNLDLKSANNTSLVYIKYQSQSASDIHLTRKIINGKLNGYGLTSSEDNGALGVYLYNYTNDFSTLKDMYKNADWKYSSYVIGKGMFSVKFHVEVKV